MSMSHYYQPTKANRLRDCFTIFCGRDGELRLIMDELGSFRDSESSKRLCGRTLFFYQRGWMLGRM